MLSDTNAPPGLGIINYKERAVPQTTAVPPSKATVDWPGWQEILKTRWDMAAAAAGEKAFVEYLDTMIKPPRRFGKNQAVRIAALLRGAPYPQALPLQEVLLVVPAIRTDDGKSIPVNVSTVGRWAMSRGVRVHYPTRHLHGGWSAPGQAKENVAVLAISSGLAAARVGADKLRTATLAHCAELLEDDMRDQLRAMRNDVFAQLAIVDEMLKAGTE
jgi:hypothetical protein